MLYIITHTNKIVQTESDRRAYKKAVAQWFRSLNEYHSSVAPTADQLISGFQPVYHVPPFTPEELAILRSLDSASE